MVVVGKVVEVGLGGGELEEGRARGTEGAEVEGVGCGEGVAGSDELLHVSPAGFAAGNSFCLLYP